MKYNISMKVKILIKRILLVVMTVVLVGVAPASTYALSSEQLDKFAQNGITFYDPDGSSDGGCVTIAGGNNYNYKGDVILSESQLKAVEANRPFYEKAAEKYDFPWQILAVIHEREHGLARHNPDNGEGAYQLHSYVRDKNGNLDPNKAFLPAGPISDDEFQRQTDIAANIIFEKANSLKADLNTDSGVKKLFFSYNGTSSKYKEQAKKMGFSDEEANNGEGSPYVMNRYDERRDPTVEPTKSNGTWGQIKEDYGPIEYPANKGFGAFVQYVALGGSSTNCNAGSLVSGGMTLEEAKTFMKYYHDKAEENKNSKDDITLDGIKLYYYPSCGSALTNCVAFSAWFLAKYTNTEKSKIPLSNGYQIVGDLINIGFENGGHIPRAYAIFSQNGGSMSNHTGVVLGVDEEKGKIIIGESGCSGTGVPNVKWTDANEYDLNEFTKEYYTYAYTDGRLINL